MEEIDIAQVKKRSLSGAITLTTRSFFLYFVAIFGTFLLTVFLKVAEFGVFYLVSAIIAFISYFSDIGLAAALIQKKEALTREDLTTAFTIQQLLVGSIVLLSLIFSSIIASFYKLETQGIWLLRALLFSFFLSSLKTIPSILLERKLQFNLFIVPQILETIGFYFVAVLLAWLGFGIASFTWAVLARGALGLISIYLISPWTISIGISQTHAKKLLRFGVPFQFNSFLALIKDDFLTIVLGFVLPITAIGYIGWAKKWSDIPLRMFMDSIIKVTFPTFSRIQHSKELLANAINKTLFGLSITIFPSYIGLFFFVEPLVKIIPKYSQWEPAILSFYFFVGASIIASLSTPLANAFNAIGKITITLRLMVLWVVSTWMLTFFLIYFIGFHGVALAVFIVSGTIILVVYFAKQIAPFKFLESIRSATIGSFLLAVFFGLFRGSYPYYLPRLIIVAFLGFAFYCGLILILEKNRIKELFAILKK